MSIRDSFVTRFGTEQADNIEMAAIDHMNGIHDNPGSDPFKWALLICIGYQCISREEFRNYHRITVPLEEVKMWALEEGQLNTHDGDYDVLGLFAGAYDEWVTTNANLINNPR